MAPYHVIQANKSEGLAQGPYVADTGGVEPATFRTEGTEHRHSTTTPLHCGHIQRSTSAEFCRHWRIDRCSLKTNSIGNTWESRGTPASVALVLTLLRVKENTVRAFACRI